MDRNVFRCMQQGTACSILEKSDEALLQAIDYYNGQQRRALLVLHGFSSSPGVYRALFPHLLPYYDGIKGPILPGHASTLETFANTKAHEWISIAENSYQELANDYEIVDVMGLSLGGVLACHLSHLFPLHHLYLLAPALNLSLPIKRTLLLLNCLNTLGFSKLRAYAGNLHTLNYCEIAYNRLPLTSIIEVLRFIQEFNFSPPRCPTDLFLGTHDTVINIKEVSQRFSDQSHIRTHWLNHSAHVLPLDGDMDKIIECIHQNSLSNS